MWQPNAEARWFALTVKPRHEWAAARALRNRGLEEFLPFYRARRAWSDRIKELEMPLFPGYVFCRFSSLERAPVLSTPGVVSIVGFGRGPAPVPDAQIDAIRKAAGPGQAVQPWPFLKQGQRVRIERGPLAGVEGILLERKGSRRLVVSVELLQRSVAVEIDGDAALPCPARVAAGLRGQ